MIIWGGIDFSGPAPFETVNTGALYDPVADSWTPTSLAGAPAPRVRHTAIWSGELMIIWGGGVSSGGRYDPSTDSWTPTSTTPSSPSQRRTHTAVWTGSEMIVWGGTRDSSGGRYDPLLDAWTPTSLTNAPSPRAYHAAVWTGREMIVWGGEGSGDLKTDSGGRYDPVSDIWTPTSLIDAPAARAYHTAVWTGREMIVWGGDVGDYLNTNTGGRYDPGSDSWSPISLVRAPSARAYHTAIWSGREMVVWGGYDDRVLNTGGRYDPASDTWSPTSPVNAPSARARQTAVWTGREMIVWGGYGEFLLNTGGRYDPLVDAWTPTPLAEAPLGRSGHSAVWTGREMIVWGGAYQDFFYVYSTNTGGRYDPAANAWAPTTTTNAPEARDLHTAVWIGTAMIVRGGEVNTGDVILLARDPYVAWYGAEAAVPSPDSDQDGFSVCAGDCDDALAAVHPGAAEVCDGLDNDCDAVVDNPPAPAGIPFLTAESSGEATLLSWSAVGMATGYDLVRGDLATLIASGGDFASVTQACLADDLGDTSLTAAEAPATAGGFWYLVRAVNCGGRGSYDSGGPAQVRPRDAGINASASSCP
jgi:N-acetylneuraminic acid mutarotase